MFLDYNVFFILECFSHFLNIYIYEDHFTLITLINIYSQLL